METLFVIALITACGLAFLKGAKGTAGMNDPETDIANIRRGVANGWYTCTLTRVNGKPAVRLSGKTTDGKQSTDVYPVSETTWQTLKNEGYKVI